MAAVYRAKDLLLDRTVAVKRLRDDLAADPVARQRFDNEGRAAAGLSHPNIVTVLDVGVDDGGVPFLVLEWLPGATLAEEIARGALRPDRVRAIGLQVLAALAEAHDHGVLHRDIKPSNIVLTASGDAKLADFGIAKTLDGQDVTSTGDVVGTIRYMAPERLRGHPTTPAADLYGLGMVLREAATGTAPFASRPLAQLTYAVCHERLAPLSSRELGTLATVINRATAQLPDHRYASATEMSTALATDKGARRGAPTQVMPVLSPGSARAAESTEVASDLTTAYQPGSEPQAAEPAFLIGKPGRNRWAGLILALLLAAVIAAGALAWGFLPRDDPTVPTTVPPTTSITSPPTTAPPVATTRPVTSPAGKGNGNDKARKNGNNQQGDSSGEN